VRWEKWKNEKNLKIVLASPATNKRKKTSSIYRGHRQRKALTFFTSYR